MHISFHRIMHVCGLQIGPDMLITGYLQPIPDSVVPAGIDELDASETASFSDKQSIISFYKSWNVLGAFSNFSPHPITVTDSDGNHVLWTSVEHYYQVHFSTKT